MKMLESDPFLIIKEIKNKIKEIDNDLDLILKNKKENIGKGNQNERRSS
jgi:hypothetical protein